MGIMEVPMRTGRPKKMNIVLTKEEREQLHSLAGSRSLPFGLVTRARIIMMTADGVSNKEIARNIGYSPYSVSRWRRRYHQQGITGLHDELRPGRPRSLPDERIAELIRVTPKTKPADGTPWPTRAIAKETESC